MPVLGLLLIVVPAGGGDGGVVQPQFDLSPAKAEVAAAAKANPIKGPAKFFIEFAFDMFNLSG